MDGYAFYRIRKDAKLNRAMLAELLGVDKTDVDDWENGRAPLPEEIVEAMEGIRARYPQPMDPIH
jgi:DNA-binding transcriptional regulator YiaG